MTYNIKNVIVVGASGNLGPHILKALLDSGKFAVSILTRASSSSTFPEGVKVIRSEYTPDALEAALKGQDAVVCTIGDFSSQGHIIDAAVKAGVQRFIPSDFCSNTQNANYVRLFPWAAIKAAANKGIEEKVKASPGFSWTSILCGAFFDWSLQTGFSGFDLKNHTALIYEEGDVRFAATMLASIGQAVVGVLLHPAETANRYVYVASAEPTQNEILAALEKATGPPKWTITKTTLAEAHRIGEEKPAGDYSGLAMIGMSATLDPNSQSEFSSFTKLDNDLLGVARETVDSLVAQVLKSQA